MIFSRQLLSISLTVIATASLCAQQRPQNSATKLLTVDSATALLLDRNAEIRCAQLESEEAQGELRQQRTLANPEVSFIYNVYNPLTDRYFDAGYDGEIDIEVELPISIGGQRRQRVARQQAVADAMGHNSAWVAYTMRMQLLRTMTSIAALQEKLSLTREALASAQRLVAAYSRQAEQGNVAQVELLRVEALELSLHNEHNEILTELTSAQNELRVMLRMEGNEDFEVSISLADDKNLGKNSVILQNSTRSDLAAWESLTQAAEHELRWQKAEALPHISLKGEYDKNGSICHNFWGIGLNVSLPVFDRNQGSRQQARTALERTQLQSEAARQQVMAERTLRWQHYERQCALYDKARRSHVAQWDIAAAERQLLNRNLSLVEFIDLYDAYREAHLLLAELQEKRLLAAIDLNESIGQEIIKIR